MSGMIESLVNILTEQVDCLNNLFLLSEEKREVIINNDIDMLKKITFLENTIINKNNKLEISRLSLMKDIADVINTDYETLTLSALAIIIDGQHMHLELLKVNEEMKVKLEQLKSSNVENRLLINNSLEYIDFNLNMIKSTFENEPTFIYNNKGKHVNNGKVFFDAKQ